MLALIGFSLPAFWVGAELIVIFAVWRNWFPATGYVSISDSPVGWLHSLVLPVVALPLYGIASTAKQTREAMLDVLASEYIRMAWANGISPRAIVFRHALRNASMRVVTVLGLLAVGLPGGTVLVENVFALPGLGSLMVTAATQHDIPVVAGMAVYFTLIVVAINMVVDSQNAGDLFGANRLPNWSHLLGTDTLGRDVLSRLLVGDRVTLVGVVEALIVVLVLAVPLGLAAGYLGGWTGRVVTWLADLTFSLPAVVIIIVVLSVFPASMLAGMTTFGVIAAPGLMRVVRSATLPIREELYIKAAEASGLSRTYILTRHVLPRIGGVVIVQASLLAAVALGVQTGLAFLKLLVADPAPSWGGMVADGTSVLLLHPWLIVPPGGSCR